MSDPKQIDMSIPDDWCQGYAPDLFKPDEEDLEETPELRRRKPKSIRITYDKNRTTAQ